MPRNEQGQLSRNKLGGKEIYRQRREKPALGQAMRETKAKFSAKRWDGIKATTLNKLQRLLIPPVRRMKSEVLSFLSLKKFRLPKLKPHAYNLSP